MTHELSIATADGKQLAASLFRASGPGTTAGAPAVLIQPATGVARRYYDRYAQFLASNGLTTVTFDYRGIGGSRPGKLRGMRASMSEWGALDIAGAIDWIMDEVCPSRLVVVGHSAGGQLLGLARNNHRVAALLAVAAQSGYWRLWPGAGRYKMALVWHALMPGLTRVLGYFPSKLLGLGENLPGGVALEWARWCRSPRYLADVVAEPEQHFATFSGPIRAYCFADDDYAPRAAVEALLELYTAAPWELVQCGPADVGGRKLGHFGFFREQQREGLWLDSLAWIRDQGAIPKLGSIEAALPATRRARASTA